MTEIVYASGWSNVQDGRQFSNARLFTKANPAAKKVFVVGNWPKVVSAYQALGIPVEVVDGKGPSRPNGSIKQKPAKQVTVKVQPIKPVLAADSGSVEISDDYRDMGWRDLRALSKQISDTPAINSQEAMAIIEAELTRRKS